MDQHGTTGRASPKCGGRASQTGYDRAVRVPLRVRLQALDADANERGVETA
jgi:hypothetical protein